MLVNLGVAAVWLVLASRSYAAWRASGSVLGLLLLGINAAIAALALSRRPSRGTSGSPVAWALGLAGTFLPLGMAPVSGVPLALQAAGALLQLVGAAGIVRALGSLGRSFGIVPANRGVVASGAYRWVRHPLYAAELLFFGGFALAAPSARNVALWLLVLGVQVLRARREERLLAGDPAYRAYLARVPHRFVPGLV